MKIIIFVLFVSFPLIAMENTQSLSEKIKDNKQLYLRTFNDSNPVIKQLSTLLNDFKTELNREKAKDPHHTFAEDPLLKQRITALEETKILMILCIREIKELDTTIAECKKHFEEKIKTSQECALEHKINREKAEDDLKKECSKNNSLTSLLEEVNKKCFALEKEKTTLITEHKNTLLYRNVFAGGFLISTVVVLGLLYFKK